MGMIFHMGILLHDRYYNDLNTDTAYLNLHSHLLFVQEPTPELRVHMCARKSGNHNNETPTKNFDVVTIV